jgi:teichuronic acid biosynthesis glycosyltransferase TuaC
VTVIAPGPGHAANDAVIVKWLPVGSAFGWPGALARIRARPWRALSAAALVVAARHALKRLGPLDAVIAHWLVPSAWPVAVAEAASAASLEVVVHGSDVRLVERLPRPVRRHLVGALLDSGATFRFVSTDLCERLARATTDAVRARCRVEPCCIDVSGVPARNVARAQLGVADDERLAVVVGRLVPSKRPEEAVRLALTRADRVVVVGDGPLAARLARAHPRATLMGRLPRSETLAWVSAADLLVSASRDEGAPTAIREARVLGAAVLAIPCGDLRQWAGSDPGITLVGG